jgi:nucleotide-binding universal stress UspA family protein
VFQKILLPLDLSDIHQTALRTAAELARQNNGKVILLHVVEVIPGLTGEEEKDFYSRLERAARAHLARLGSPLSRAKIPCRSEVITGHRAVDVVRFASANHVDLILLTSPPFQREHTMLVLGSMAWKISMLASCPVLLVKNSETKTEE